MYRLTQKTLDILDILEYSQDRVFNNSSEKGWTIGKTNKFIALGMTKDEGVARGFLEIVPDNPLRELCKINKYIPHDWIKKNLSEQEYTVFVRWMNGQAQSEYGVYWWDLVKFLDINSL